MKRFLTFIPLGIGISSAIIYVFNIISFRAINNTVAMSQILTNLRIYLYISIISFILYVLLKILFFINGKKEPKPVIIKEPKEKVIKVKVKNKPVKPVKVIDEDEYIPMFENKEEVAVEEPVVEEPVAYEPFNVVTANETIKEEKIIIADKKCPKCNTEIFDGDTYCRNCGYNMKKNKKRLSPFIKNVINVIEIVIMILIIYFIISVLLDYKAKVNPNFKSPFKVTMTK